MPIQGQIAEGVVKVVVQGIAALQQQLTRVRSDFAKTAQAATVISSAATASFANATGSIKGLVAAADPMGWMRFEMALARVSVQIGSVFIPLVQTVTKWLGQLADYFHGLSDATRENVLTFAKYGLALTGVVTVGAKLVGIVSALVGTFGQLVPFVTGVASALWRVVGFLGPWGRLAVVVGSVAAALLGLRSAGEDVNGTMGKVVGFFRAAWDTITRLWSKLSDTFSPLLEKIAVQFDAAFGKVVGAVTKLWQGLAPSVLPVIERLIESAGQLLGPLVDGFATAVESVSAALEQIDIDQVVTGMKVGFAAVLSIVQKVGATLTHGFASAKAVVGPVVDSVTQKVGPLVTWLGKMFTWTGEAFSAALEKAGPVLEWLGRIGQRVADSLRAGFDAIWPHVQAGATKVRDAFLSVVQVVGKAIEDVIDWLVRTLNSGIDKINHAITAVNVANPGRQIPLVPRIETQPAPPRPDPKRDEMVRQLDDANWAARRAFRDSDDGELIKRLDQERKRLADALRDYDSGKRDTAKPEAVQVAPKPVPVKADKPPTSRPADAPRFAGQLIDNIRIVGISDAMRAAQQSLVPSVEQAARQEVLKRQAETVSELKKANANLESIKDVLPVGLGY